MINTIDDVDLDDNNLEFKKAVEFVHSTDKLVYLTGKAGTGKTTFLKYIKATTKKSTVILAPTGVAAVNAGGQTIHSFFKLPFSPFVPNDSRLGTRKSADGHSIFETFRYRSDEKEAIKNLDLLIIDEVSMVRVDIIDVIDRILRVFRGQPQIPFGGVQVVLIGDAFQLSPIAKYEEWSILNEFYKTAFFFSANVIQQNLPVYIELNKIYRQKEQEFIDLLNKVRTGQVSQNDLSVLESKFDPTFTNPESDHIILATTNRMVQETNTTKLHELKAELYTFRATITDDFPSSSMPTEEVLELKEGAQIMMIKNRKGAYHNGSLGKVISFNEDSIRVELDSGNAVVVEKEKWENRRFVYNKEKRLIEEEVVGTFEQYPLKLAWAITVHKSQGLTFEKVYADLGNAFATGQVYVALSRCTSFNGLKLKSNITKASIKVHQAAVEFAKEVTPDTLVNSHLSEGKADFLYKKAREEFKKGQVLSAFLSAKEAMKYRNDLEKEEFERIVTIYSQRAVLGKEILAKQNQDLQTLRTESMDLLEKLTDTQKNFKQEQLTSAELEKVITVETQEKRLLEIEITNLKKRLNVHKKEKSDIKLKLLAGEDSYTKLKNQYGDQLKQVEELKSLSWIKRLKGFK